MNVTTNASILVVEDSPELNFALCETLLSFGYQATAASNGYEALDYLHKQRPDVVLCDIMMPEMDGYGLLQRARSDPALRTMPFIFLTARTSPEDQRRAKEIGIEDYLTKPVDSGDLVIAIENALQRSRLMQVEAQRQLDDLRNRIVGILQHEFRTPLTFVLGYAELIANADERRMDMEELRIAASAILDGGRRLQRLIEGFLLLAELQNRSLAPQEMESVTAWTLWGDVARDFADIAAGAGLRIYQEPQHRQPLVLCDTRLLTEALQRLVDNAIRYRRPNSRLIVLSIELEGAYLGFRIRDEGAGIAADRLVELLQPFGQGVNDRVSGQSAGLSLPVINHIAHMHGGSLEVQSTPGVGSTFTLWLPAAST